MSRLKEFLAIGFLFVASQAVAQTLPFPQCGRDYPDIGRPYLPSNEPNSANIMHDGQCMKSSDGRYFLELRSDGGLVRHDTSSGEVLDLTRRWGRTAGGYFLYMMGFPGQGNLAEYQGSITPNSWVYSNGSMPVGYYYAVIENSGEIYIHHGLNPQNETPSTVPIPFHGCHYIADSNCKGFYYQGPKWGGDWIGHGSRLAGGDDHAWPWIAPKWSFKTTKESWQ